MMIIDRIIECTVERKKSDIASLIDGIPFSHKHLFRDIKLAADSLSNDYSAWEKIPKINQKLALVAYSLLKI